MIQQNSIPILSCNQATHQGQQVNVLCLRVGCKYSPAQCQMCTFELHKDCIEFSKQLKDIPNLIEPDQQLTSQLIMIQQKINNLFKELIASIQQQLQPISTYLDNKNLSNLNELGLYFRKRPSETVKHLVVQKLKQLNLIFEEYIKVFYIQPETDYVNPPYVSNSKQIQMKEKPKEIEKTQKIAQSSQIELKQSIITSQSLQPIQKVNDQSIQLTQLEQPQQIPNGCQNPQQQQLSNLSLGNTDQSTKVFHFGTVYQQYNQQNPHGQFQRQPQHSYTVNSIPNQMVTQQQPQQFFPPTRISQPQNYPALPIGTFNQLEISEAIVNHLAAGINYSEIDNIWKQWNTMKKQSIVIREIKYLAQQRYQSKYSLGNQLFELQEYKIAIYYYENATQIDKMNQKIWLEKGIKISKSQGQELFEYQQFELALIYLDNSMKYNKEATVSILETYIKRLFNSFQSALAKKYAEKIMYYQYSVDKARFYLNCNCVNW